MARMTKHISNYETGTNGAFMGFETSESEDTENSDLEQGVHAEDVSIYCNMWILPYLLWGTNCQYYSLYGYFLNLN
jgi:hypothetical protein